MARTIAAALARTGVLEAGTKNGVTAGRGSSSSRHGRWDRHGFDTVIDPELEPHLSPTLLVMAFVLGRLLRLL